MALAYTRVMSTIATAKTLAAGASLSTAGTTTGSGLLTGIRIYTTLNASGFVGTPTKELGNFVLSMAARMAPTSAAYTTDPVASWTHPVTGDTAQLWTHWVPDPPRCFSVFVKNNCDKATANSGLSVAIEFVRTSA